MQISMRRFHSAPFRWLLFLTGLAVITAITAAYLPGPWHDDGETLNHECHCPVCKIAGQGLVDSHTVIQPELPTPIQCFLPLDPVDSGPETFVEKHPARAPPA